MVTTVTTVTTIAALGFTTALSIGAVVTLILFLASREMAATANSRLSLRIARFATIGILPLVMAFTAIVTVKIFEIL